MSLYFEKRKWSRDQYNITGYERKSPFGRERVRGILSRMPGSPTIWVSHGLFVPPSFRGAGYSKQYNTTMLTLAFDELGASAVTCSVKFDNERQQQRLRGLGWYRISRAIWLIKPGLDDTESASELFEFYPPLVNCSFS